MSGMRQRHYHNNSELDTHVSHIQQMVARGLNDGEYRKLAVKVVSGRFDLRTLANGVKIPVVEAWGRYFPAPPGKVCRTEDDECEIIKVWDFVVQNIRYVHDTVNVDVFASLKETLLAGGGDCDDLTIAFGTLLGHLGFTTVGRVISTKDAPNDWAHIFPLVGVPKANPSKWIALDASVHGATPGWIYPAIAKYKDYPLSQP